MDRSELDHAFRAHRTLVDEIFASGDWARYADEFTLDATYRRPGHPEIVGREAIRDWVVTHLAGFPACHIGALDVTWHSLDLARATVVYEVRSTMSDPGDGSVLTASTITSMGYAGNGLWAWGVDTNNPRAYLDMFAQWTRIAQRHGLVPPPRAASRLITQRPAPLSPATSRDGHPA